jgi:hypothetical protein
MKHTTLHKIGLTTIALLASLALSAQGGTKAKVSATGHSLGKNKVGMTAKSSGQNGPLATYQIDDGTMEDSVGFGDGSQNFESLWFNQFDVIPGAETITSVEVAWGTPAFPDPSLDGEAVTIAVWSDPNNDGNPSDGVLLGSVPGTIQNSGTDTFVTYTLSPAITLPAGATSFFVGDMTPAHPGFEQFPQGLDENSTLHRQSWVAAMSSGAPVDINNLGNNDFIGLIDDFGLPGNWGIRANSGNATPTPTPSSTPTPTPMGNALWYNGDFDGVDGLTNEQDTFASGFSHIYDDFNVPDEAGWDVDSVFSNDLVSTTIIGASWEIRQGITSGNGGALIASGTTVTPVVTPTGRSGFGFTEFTVEVTGLDVHLDGGSGVNYHLNVTPIGNLDGNRAFDSTTSGANCIGTPCGDNDNAFLDSTLFGAVFEPVADFGSQFHDFSMGVNGTVTGGGGGITLSAFVRRVHGNRLVALSWTPANGGDVNIVRDGAVIHTTADDGVAQDRLGTGQREVHVYQVCETDTGTCSNEVKVKVPGSGQ